jgi:hypothetical protein
MATITDSFAYTENPISNGGLWETDGGNWANCATDGAQARTTVEDTEWGGARATTPSIGNDQYAQVVLTILSSSGGGGPAVRMGSGTNNVAYFVDAVIDGSHWTSLRAIKKTDATLGVTTLATTTDTFASGDTIRLEVSGTALTAKKNGSAFSPALSATDGDIGSGQPGFVVKCNSATLTNVEVDNFEGGDLVTGRTTKNTRAFPLGMAVGMNWVQAGHES